jgi:hypothetical protein
MKNPFEKEDHTGLIIGIAAGITAGIGLGWLYLTDNGAVCRRQISRKFKETVSDSVAEIINQKTFIPKKLPKQRPTRSLKINERTAKHSNFCSPRLWQC